MIDPGQVAMAHDMMADEYDQLDDLWYPWLFARIHEFIASRLPADGVRRRRAVDAGTGTGFQAFLLARAGYEVLGFDIAEALLEVARGKCSTHAVAPLHAPPLFRSRKSLSWLQAHHDRLGRKLERARNGRPVVIPRFEVGDLARQPLEGGHDVATCCGSVLCFIDSYADALDSLARALRPGGLLFLEVEQKRNIDLLWPLVDKVFRGALDYNQEWLEIFRNLCSRPGTSVRINYPFELHGGEELILPIWLFSVRELERLFVRSRLRIIARLGVHHVTNLIPSTILHSPHPHPFLAEVFERLRMVEQWFGGSWPSWRLGCSVLYCLERMQ